MKNWFARQLASVVLGGVFTLVTGHWSLVTAPAVWADEPETASMKADIEVLKARIAEL